VGERTAHSPDIDSFIPPDRLDSAYLRDNLARVRGAAQCAVTAGAKIVSLGGSSSILIEGNFDLLPEKHDTVFTTGNTFDRRLYRSRHQEDVYAGRARPAKIDVAYCWSDG
jgi:predicted amino acid dehydrogenase